MGNGGKNGGTTIDIYDYLSSHDYGICHGPVTLNELWIKDKVVFKCGNYDEREDISVNLPKLFGGDSAEGGPVGTVEFYPGTFTQTMSAELSGRYGLTPETAPGYRGLAHIFLRGDDGKGFKWTTNNPYQPNPRVNVTRAPQTQEDLNPDERLIPASVGIDANGNLISSAGGDFFLNPDMVGFGGPSVADDPDGPGAGNASGDLNILTYRDNAKNPNPEDVVSSWNNETFYVHNLATIWGLDSTILQTAIDEGVPFRAQVEVNLQQTGTGGTAEARIHFVVILDNGTRLDNSIPYETATDTLYERETVEVELPANAVDIEAYFTYTRPSGDFVSVTALLRIGRTLLPDTTSGGVAGTTTGGTSGPIWQDPGPGTMASLQEAGWSDEAVSGGYVFAVSTIQADAIRTRLGSGPEAYVLQIFHRFWRDATQAEIDAGDDTNGYIEVAAPDAADAYWTEGGDQLTLVTQAPVAAQYFQYSHNAVLVYPLFAAFTRLNSSWFFRGAAFGTGPGNGGTDGGGDPSPESVCGPYPDANPMHIIFECLRDKDWGLGEDASALDVTAFAEASTTLYNEKFGLSMGWFGQEEIEKFIQEVLDHIKCFLFQSPITGLWTPKLLRDDYTIDENTPHFDETNCDAVGRKRRGWGETINEVLCSYTNPGDEKGATVAAHNLGNMQIQGGIVSETRDYYGIRNPYLAQKVASRDVAEAGYPLFSCQLKVDRSAWTILPGDVVTFSWPEDGIENMVLRVMSLDYGDPKQKTITIDVVEDIFALDVSFYGPPQDPLDPVIPTPEPLDPPDDPDPDDPTGGTGGDPDPTVQTADQIGFTVPVPVLQKQGFSIADIDAATGSAGIMFLAYPDDQPVLDVELWTEVTLPNSSTEQQAVALFNTVGSIKKAGGLAREHTSTLTKAEVDTIFDNNPKVGNLIFIGRSEAVHELAMLDTYDSMTETWTIRRGMWDTVPLAWPSGTRMWPQPLGASKMDPAQRLDGDSITYRLLPRTGAGRLAFSAASDLTVEATNRAHAPFRPANCQLDGNGFGVTEYLDAMAYPTEVTATWSNRNRTTEDAVYMNWNQGDVTPESGQTVTLKILNLDGTLSSSITGLTGTSHAIPIATLEAVGGGSGSGFVEFVAVHDGEESLYNCRLRFNVLPGSGYGKNYGKDYV